MKEMRKGTLRSSDLPLNPSVDIARLSIRKDEVERLEIKKDLSKIKENYTDSDEEKLKKRTHQQQHSPNEGMSRNSPTLKDKQQTQRAYEYYKLNIKNKEDIYLG